MDFHDIGKFLSEAIWAIAGFLGAVLGSFFHRDELESKTDYLMFLASGFACAFFFTNWAVSYFHVDGGNIGAVGFLLGAFGGSILAAVTRAIRAADLWSVIKQRLGGTQ